MIDFLTIKDNKKSMRIKFIFLLLVCIIYTPIILAQSIDIKAPVQSSVGEYTLAQLAVHDFNPSDNTDVVEWVSFYNKYKNGMSILQKEIIMHPDLYPMQDLENEDRKEPDNFRRWEYQMRQMKAKIITPESNFLKVDFSSNKTIAFCSDEFFSITVKVKNISKTNLPMFYFFIKTPQGIILDERNIQLPENVSFIKSSNVFVFNKGLNKDRILTINLKYSVGCDGHGGSPILKGKSKRTYEINWKLVLIGYLLDYQKKNLYKVIDFGKHPKRIILTKN